MITDITIGQYFPGKSFIHKLDARTKILLTLVFLVFIFVCKNFYSLLLVCGFGVGVYLLSRISPKVILKSFKPLLPIVLLTTILQLYYIKDGNMLFEWKFISITDKGVFTAIFIAARILTLLLVSSLLTYTTSPTDLTDAIEKLLSPLKIFKIEVHTFAMMMTIALRFIPTLVDEIDRIIKAYSDEVSARIAREVNEQIAVQEFEVEQKRLQESLSETVWQRLDESSKEFLTTAKITYSNYPDDGNKHGCYGSGWNDQG